MRFSPRHRLWPLRCSCSNWSADSRKTREEAAVLENAMKNLNFRYLDTTETQTDQMLDSLGVARLTTAEIAQAIEAVVFDME